MKRVRLIIDPELSDRLYTMLVAVGVAATLVGRGQAGDVVTIPRRHLGLARRLMAGL